MEEVVAFEKSKLRFTVFTFFDADDGCGSSEGAIVNGAGTISCAEWVSVSLSDVDDSGAHEEVASVSWPITLSCDERVSDGLQGNCCGLGEVSGASAIDFRTHFNTPHLDKATVGPSCISIGFTRRDWAMSW